jgi:hypothetical protein
MNKIKYVINTRYGNTYQISKEGYVLKYSNGLDKMNASIDELTKWQILGLVEIKPFGNIGHLISLNEAIHIKDFKFKNGKPKYTLVDLDNGTTRIVGNTQYHGVSNFSIGNE